MFYRSTVVNNKNKIVINNIKIEHPKDFIIEEKIPVKNIEDIISDLITNYNDIIEDKGSKDKLGNFDLINSKYKRIYLGYLLDKIPYIERSKYIRFLLDKYFKDNDFKDIIVNEDTLSAEINEIHKMAYDYFKSNFIYSKGNKKILFDFDNDNPIGYFIINDNKVMKTTKKLKKRQDILLAIDKCVEYYKKTKDSYIKIEPVKGNLDINTGKYWVHSYWNKGSVLKLIEEPNLGKECHSICFLSKDEFIDYLKINIDEPIFTKLRKDILLLSKFTKGGLCKLIDIVFRIKNNKDISYFVKFDLLYHKINLNKY